MTLNETDSGNSTTSPYTHSQQATILVFMAIISLGSIVGNTIVFIAYIKVKKLRRATNYFILSLAAADLFVGAIVINVYTMYMLLGHWPLSSLTCVVWLCSDYWVFQASVFGVLMIAVDRYLSIRFPHKYRHRRSDRKVKIAIILMWLFSFALWVPLIVSYSFAGTDGGSERIEKHVCHIGSARNVYVTAVASAFAYVIPVIVIIGLASQTFRLLLSMKRPSKSRCYTSELSSAGESCVLDRSVTDSSDFDSGVQEAKVPGSPCPVTFKNADRDSSINIDTRKTSLLSKAKDPNHVPITIDVKKVCKAYRNLDDYQRIATFNIIIAIAFVITVFPYGIISVIKAFCDDCVSSEWWHFAYIMCYINSLLNPLCYAFGNKNFNRAFRTILCPASFPRAQDSDYCRTPSMKEKMEDHRVFQIGANI